MQRTASAPRPAGPAKVIGYTLDAYGFRTAVLDRPAAQVDETDHGLTADEVSPCGHCETGHCTC